MKASAQLQVKTAKENVLDMLKQKDIYENVTDHKENSLNFTAQLSLHVIEVDVDQFIFEIRIEDSMQDKFQITTSDYEITVTVDSTINPSLRLTYHPNNQQFVIWVGNDNQEYDVCYLSPFGWWDGKSSLLGLMLATAAGRLK